MSLFNGKRAPAGILNAPREPVRFSPPGSEAVYVIRQPTAMERPRYKAEVARHAADMGLRSWGALDLARLAKSEVVRIMEAGDPEERDDSIVEELDGYIASIRQAFDAWNRDRSSTEAEAAVDRILNDGTPRLEQIQQLLSDVSGSYASRIADNAAYNAAYGDVALLVAVKMFVTAWEGVDIPPCRRDATGIADDVLALIPGQHITAVGRRVRELIEPSEQTLKNSPSASSGDSSPGHSTETSSEPTPPPSSPPQSRSGTSPSPDGATSDSIPATS